MMAFVFAFLFTWGIISAFMYCLVRVQMDTKHEYLKASILAVILFPGGTLVFVVEIVTWGCVRLTIALTKLMDRL